MVEGMRAEALSDGPTQLAAIILRGHGHPSLPQVVFYLVNSLRETVTLRERCLESPISLTWTVVTPLMTGKIHMFDTRSGVPVAIHYFEPFLEAPEAGIEPEHSRYMDQLATLISSIHGIENKDGGPVKLPWLYAINLTSSNVGDTASSE